MDDLIEALTILRKYENHRSPTNCDHDVLYINMDKPEAVNEADKKRLSELSFNQYEYGFESFRFGSC